MKNTTEQPTDTQLSAAVQIILAVGDAIRELGSIPSGHLYVHLMSKLTLAQYDQCIEQLVKAGLVRRDRSHLLTWIGTLGTKSTPSAEEPR